MNPSARVWTASIWIGPPEKEEIFFGSSLEDIRENVSNWVLREEPSELANVSSDHEITRKYFYRQATEEEPLFPPVFPGDDQEPITNGWVGADCGSRSLTDNDYYDSIEGLVGHLISSSLRIKKGPDWKEIEIVESNIPLHLIRTVKRVDDESVLNDHLQVGWYLLSIDTNGTQDYEGRLESQLSEYVIGHPEDNATIAVTKGTPLQRLISWDLDDDDVPF